MFVQANIRSQNGGFEAQVNGFLRGIRDLAHLS